MGYSCRADASKVLDLWDAKCVTETGSSNTWSHGPYGAKRFFEIGREQDDGAITGTILEFIGNDHTKETNYAKKVGTFKVGPDGAFVRGPAFLKALCEEASKLTDAECRKARWSAEDRNPAKLLEKV